MGGINCLSTYLYGLRQDHTCGSFLLPLLSELVWVCFRASNYTFHIYCRHMLRDQACCLLSSWAALQGYMPRMANSREPSMGIVISWWKGTGNGAAPWEPKTCSTEIPFSVLSTGRSSWIHSYKYGTKDAWFWEFTKTRLRGLTPIIALQTVMISAFLGKKVQSRLWFLSIQFLFGSLNYYYLCDVTA